MERRTSSRKRPITGGTAALGKKATNDGEEKEEDEREEEEGDHCQTNCMLTADAPESTCPPRGSLGIQAANALFGLPQACTTS